jgi:hypothetical protein
MSRRRRKAGLAARCVPSRRPCMARLAVELACRQGVCACCVCAVRRCVVIIDRDKKTVRARTRRKHACIAACASYPTFLPHTHPNHTTVCTPNRAWGAEGRPSYSPSCPLLLLLLLLRLVLVQFTRQPPTPPRSPTPTRSPPPCCTAAASRPQRPRRRASALRSLLLLLVPHPPSSCPAAI